MCGDLLMSAADVVTIDGPAGVGKTTLARSVAEKMGIAYLDTGAMFRCLAMKLGAGAENLSPEVLREKSSSCRFTLSGSGASSVLACDGIPIGAEVRTEEVGMLASRVAAVPVVREILKERQREIASAVSLVVEGRDMGTVVFPSARHKFFLDARAEVRAQRRFLDLQARGQSPDLEKLICSIRERDTLDRTRAVAPLRPASDAIIIDTSDLDIQGVLQCILQHISDKK